MKTLPTLAILLAVALIFGATENLDYVKQNAADKWSRQGFKVIDYEGYQWGWGLPGVAKGGAHVWYRLKRDPDNGIIYSGHLQRWGNEIHVFGPVAIDAIKP